MHQTRDSEGRGAGGTDNMTSSAGDTETHPPPGPEPVLGDAPNMKSSAGDTETHPPPGPEPVLGDAAT